MIDIDCIDQSVEIDDTLVSFIDLSRFYRFHRFLFCSSQNEEWFHANSEFVVNRGAIEGRRIKQFIDFIITFLIKSFKKSYLLFNLFHHDYNAKKD